MSKTKSFLLWLLAFVITVASAVYQKSTGPTYPIKGSLEVSGISYEYKQIRSHGGESDAPISIIMPESMNGQVSYKRFRTNDTWQTIPMVRNGEHLTAYLPHQPPAGKLEYTITLSDGVNDYQLSESPVVIRFKGAVPAGVLIPHILFMFIAMLVSTRTGIEAIAKGSRTLRYTTITLVSLLIGGLILGPIVQNYAFGAYWTGWPMGGDWTDNKTIIAFLFWIVAFVFLRRKPQNRLWPLVATLVLFAVYMIPHSMGGSELDAETGEVTTGLKE